MNKLKMTTTKQKVINKLMGFEKTIYQEGDKTHQDSFWYDGGVVQFKLGNREILVEAVGEICIRKKDGGKVSLDIFKDDKDLNKKVGQNYDDEMYWDNNNWFEIFYLSDGVWNETQIICYGYDEALKEAEKLLYDDKFWEEVNDDKKQN